MKFAEFLNYSSSKETIEAKEQTTADLKKEKLRKWEPDLEDKSPSPKSERLSPKTCEKEGDLDF